MSDPNHTFLTSPWYAMGQNVDGELRINETATRARAGILNGISAATIFILLGRPEIDIVIYVGPIVIFDMITAAVFGLTPLSPTGLLGTAITMKFEALWKPTNPKRFAWTLGAGMGITCTLMRLFNIRNEYIALVVIMCYVLTWLEGVLGFCVGCWMYRILFMRKAAKKEECVACAPSESFRASSSKGVPMKVDETDSVEESLPDGGSSQELDC
mmetsp:Transcript_1432/g.1926  ORF Transcript_1432/g.1926 Transcript_1432/m.1926 type:complete len:214 (+) Transcript_1432:91-732(+)|eukprot:CAMPEP_0178905616 /NCGR_PEP_ID=MMETSP0786-20121207/6374_1 /TAXON_ID=186022 /ORGANISM="Thalassionema frauenfeldii, Strain CCMP 1798" /LENGTH=213 /DNA_ID=CAMNT_0020577243 /DNA_START=6 /DNA_END=647 /DNA_ORIENTATION=+